MNAIRRFIAGKVGLVLCGSAVGVLTGCVYEQRPAPRVQAALAVSYPGLEIRAESDFYEPLTPYGRWEVVGTYGRCWIPGRVEADWRPYCNGYWQRTDAGWYWASDEPWGWATYHYGRWDLSPQFGWYWVPQIQWAPAWVSWHEGGGYVGWAPLHPSARISANGAVQLNAAVIAPRAYVFVEPRHFLQPVRPSTVVVNNTTIINNTVNITNIKVVNKTVINEGPRTTLIEQASGRKVQPVAVRELRLKEEAPVAARQRVAPAVSDKEVRTPVRETVKPVEKKAQAEPERRAREPEPKVQNIQAETPKNAKELEKKASPQVAPRAGHSETNASPVPQRPGTEKNNAVKKGAKKEKKPAKKNEPTPPEKPNEPTSQPKS